MTGQDCFPGLDVPGWLMFEFPRSSGTMCAAVAIGSPAVRLRGHSWVKIDHITGTSCWCCGRCGPKPAGVWLIWGAMLADQFDPFAAGSPLWFCVTLDFPSCCPQSVFCRGSDGCEKCGHRNGGWTSVAFAPAAPTKVATTPLCRRWSHWRSPACRMGPWGGCHKSLLWSLPPMAGW